jgi:hypothetical protein
MDGMRLSPPGEVSSWVACCRCETPAQSWDRIAARAYCPSCEEAIILGDAPPLVERTERRYCAVCHSEGTVRYLTYPLNSSQPVEIDLCPEHLRGLLGRRLGSHAFAQLRRQLYLLGLNVADVFLLHEAFYDPNGRALQPANEPL